MNRTEVKHMRSTVNRFVVLEITTIAEARLFAYVADEQLAKRNHDLGTISEALGMPMSTLSRVAFVLHGRGLLQYREQVGDRRKKIVHAVIP